MAVRTPWHIVCIKRRKKKNRQSKRVSRAFLQELLKFFTSEVSPFWLQTRWIFHVLCDRFKGIFFCWSNNAKRSDNIFLGFFCFVYVKKASYHWLPEKMIDPRYLSLKMLLAVFSFQAIVLLCVSFVQNQRI